jgi:hypothetical protein
MPVAPEHAGGGPVYFAWANADETTFGPEHIRYDEYIFKFDIVLEEGKLPTATLDMKNPGALLAPGRQRWAWIAFDDDSGVTQKFFGSIVAVPSSIFNRIVTVQFIAKPLDYLARKQALAETLKVAPYYDKLFIDPKLWDDPDTILEARAAAWHHDPVTHEVTISDYLVGEDGEDEFLASDAIYDSVRFEIGEPPKRKVAMDASVVWTQTATGTIALPTMNVISYTSEGLLNDWPKPLATLDGGWSVESSSAIDHSKVASAYVKTFNYSWKNNQKEHNNGDAMSVTMTQTYPVRFGGASEINRTRSESFVIGDPETGRAAARSLQTSSTFLLVGSVQAELGLRYSAKRDRSEHLKFTLSADLQLVLNDAGGTDDIETLTLQGGDVGQVLPGDTGPPIGDLSRRTYFPTERGAVSARYAICVSRAHLLQGSRVVTVSFDCPFRRALNLSCRKNARLHDGRLPGGAALGKIIKVTLSGDGSGGAFVGHVVLGCAIGNGAAIEEVEGTPVYVDADVLGPETQVFTGRLVALPSSDIVYPPPTDAPDDDGLVFPLTRDQAVVRYEIKTSDLSQADAIAAASSPFKNPVINSTMDLVAQAQNQGTVVNDVFSNAQIWVELELKPVTNGPFTAQYVFDAALSVPKQVDLGAI